MKYIISTFVLSALTVMSFKVQERIEFQEFFKMAFDKSYEGLEKMKDPNSGTWASGRIVGDFNSCEIHYDLEKGIHGINFVTKVEKESTAAEFMNRYDDQVLFALPSDKYRKSQTASIPGKKIVYEYRSTDLAEIAKNPTVQMEVVKRGNGYEMVISLFEPFNRQSAPLSK